MAWRQPPLHGAGIGGGMKRWRGEILEGADLLEANLEGADLLIIERIA